LTFTDVFIEITPKKGNENQIPGVFNTTPSLPQEFHPLKRIQLNPCIIFKYTHIVGYYIRQSLFFLLFQLSWLMLVIFLFFYFLYQPPNRKGRMNIRLFPHLFPSCLFQFSWAFFLYSSSSILYVDIKESRCTTMCLTARFQLKEGARYIYLILIIFLAKVYRR
jgi:hypothetical protein